MAVLSIHLGAPALEMQTEVVVTLPESPPPAGGYPTLYLLHGLGDDGSAWTRWTGIERYAEQRGLAVVMPSGGRSFYTDEANGLAWFTWIAEQLPERLGGMLALNPSRETTFVAGLSMGGYGALKWSLRYPERFAAAASMSGALGWARRMPDENWPSDDLQLRHIVLGDRDATDSDDDVLHLLGRTAVGDLPALYVACGEQDFLIEENLAFLAQAELLGVPVERNLRPGDHEWSFWDAEIQRVIDWLPVPAAS
ncbi:alpha/beta hydrolase family protein [Schumannella sp. 10F1B-5-1]|uniref:alpha/beta hydrolase n=1 Tax=Schumannella sp. 10F1B-5-1 TaxID=2590780 RepID=UPI0021059C93|nr:alpha/beta hydrolase family protein [Schumannella sp. 10F1B-5-1]